MQYKSLGVRIQKLKNTMFWGTNATKMEISRALGKNDRLRTSVLKSTSLFSIYIWVTLFSCESTLTLAGENRWKQSDTIFILTNNFGYTTMVFNNSNIKYLPMSSHILKKGYFINIAKYMTVIYRDHCTTLATKKNPQILDSMDRILKDNHYNSTHYFIRTLNHCHLSDLGQ